MSSKGINLQRSQEVSKEIVEEKLARLHELLDEARRHASEATSEYEEDRLSDQVGYLVNTIKAVEIANGIDPKEYY